MALEQIGRHEPDAEAELKRLLEIGALLASVLSPEEVESLKILMANMAEKPVQKQPEPIDLEIGNTSVT